MDDTDWEIMRQQEAEEAEEEDVRLLQVAAVGVLVYAGAEESRQLHVERQWVHHTYLTCPELQPHPCEESAWKRLYHSWNDQAFITTMEFNVQPSIGSSWLALNSHGTQWLSLVMMSQELLLPMYTKYPKVNTHRINLTEKFRTSRINLT